MIFIYVFIYFLIILYLFFFTFTRIIELEEGSGNEDCDNELLEKFCAMELQDLERYANVI